MNARKAAAISLFFLPFTAWSRDITVVVLVLAAIVVLFDADARRAIASLQIPRPAFSAIAFVLWATAALFWAPHNPWSAWAKAFLVAVATVLLAKGLRAVAPERLRQVTPLISSACIGLLFLLLIERVADGFFIHLVRRNSIPDLLFNVLAGD